MVKTTERKSLSKEARHVFDVLFHIIYKGETPADCNLIVGSRQTIKAFCELFEHQPDLQKAIRRVRVVDRVNTSKEKTRRERVIYSEAQ